MGSTDKNNLNQPHFTPTGRQEITSGGTLTEEDNFQMSMNNLDTFQPVHARVNQVTIKSNRSGTSDEGSQLTAGMIARRRMEQRRTLSPPSREKENNSNNYSSIPLQVLRNGNQLLTERISSQKAPTFSDV